MWCGKGPKSLRKYLRSSSGDRETLQDTKELKKSSHPHNSCLLESSFYLKGEAKKVLGYSHYYVYSNR